MEFQKPNRVVIPLRPLIEKLIDGKITKDLCENEEICPVCNGFGIKIITNVYGLKNDPDNGKPGQPMYPYKNQHLTLMSCMDCTNGVVRRCKLCGELIRRGWLKHDCEQQRALDRAEEERKEAEILAKAPVAPPEVEKACEMFFSDSYEDGFFSDWDEFFEYWWDNDKDGEGVKRPEYVWITKPEEMKIDAMTVCEMATQDLYEGAYEDISDRAIERLQTMLNEWCQSSGVGTTHRVSQKYKVRVPWEDYNKWVKDENLDE